MNLRLACKRVLILSLASTWTYSASAETKNGKCPLLFEHVSKRNVLKVLREADTHHPRQEAFTKIQNKVVGIVKDLPESSQLRAKIFRFYLDALGAQKDLPALVQLEEIMESGINKDGLAREVERLIDKLVELRNSDLLLHTLDNYEKTFRGAWFIRSARWYSRVVTCQDNESQQPLWHELGNFISNEDLNTSHFFRVLNHGQSVNLKIHPMTLFSFLPVVSSILESKIENSNWNEEWALFADLYDACKRVSAEISSFMDGRDSKAGTMLNQFIDAPWDYIESKTEWLTKAEKLLDLRAAHDKCQKQSQKESVH